VDVVPVIADVTAPCWSLLYETMTGSELAALEGPAGAGKLVMATLDTPTHALPFVSTNR
jgi:hypothetical protein